MPDYRRILITGAAGSLGSHLRPGLAPLAEPPAARRRAGRSARPRRTRSSCAATSPTSAAALEATRDCDAILHFAGHPREQTFEEIVADTLPGSYHMFEGARLHGARRVVYASSIHAVGFYAVEAVPDTRAMHRPDTFYGLTKTFTEDLASLYWDKFGIESVCSGICSCFEEPRDRRMLWSWLCFADCVRLAEAALTAPRVGFSVIYGTSDNAARAVSNAHAAHIGFRPQDSADGYAAAVLAAHRAPRPDRGRDPGRRRRLRRDRPPRRCRLSRRALRGPARDLAGRRDPAARPLDAAARRRGGNRTRPRRSTARRATSPRPRRRCAPGASARSSSSARARRRSTPRSRRAATGSRRPEDRSNGPGCHQSKARAGTGRPSLATQDARELREPPTSIQPRSGTISAFDPTTWVISTYGQGGHHLDAADRRPADLRRASRTSTSRRFPPGVDLRVPPPSRRSSRRSRHNDIAARSRPIYQ